MNKQQTGNLQKSETRKGVKTDKMKQEENVQQLLDDLRDQYIVYNEACTRCQIEIKKTQQNYHENRKQSFYFPPNVPFLMQPEKQKGIRRDIINEITSNREAEPLYLLPDTLHYKQLDAIADRSHPDDTRKMFNQFFDRKAGQIKHKKYKLLNRWANCMISATDVDKHGTKIDQRIGKLQKELDSTLERSERLSIDDLYKGSETAERPKPISKNKDEEGKLLYVEQPHKAMASSLRLDDFEVYLRQNIYSDITNRHSKKLVKEIKYLPFSQRFDIWASSRDEILRYRHQFQIRSYSKFQVVAERLKNKMNKIGFTDEKVITQVQDCYTKHINREEFHISQEQLLQSHQSNYEQPPFLAASNMEVKVCIEEYFDEFNILNKDMDTDNGYQFNYQVSQLFPGHFQKQILMFTFDKYDTGQEPDLQLMERLSKDLGINQTKMLSEMMKYAEIERNKSILGKLSEYDTTKMIGDKAKMSESQFHLDSMIRRIKQIDFFSLDETQYKLKTADWLDQVCFHPNISDYQKRQNNLLSNENSIDTLLKNAFDIIDVNDSQSVLKQLEDYSIVHKGKVNQTQDSVKEYFKKFERQKQKSSKIDLDNNIMLEAVKKKQLTTEDDEIDIKKHEILNIDAVNESLIKSYYCLRILRTRDIKVRLIHVLNYFRSIQKQLCNELRQYYQRERVLGDVEFIGPHYGRDGSGHRFQDKVEPGGPGGIFNQNTKRQLDSNMVPENVRLTEEEKKQMNNPLTVKAFKYQNQFNPQILATCPCIPRFHNSYGQPELYEQVSDKMMKDRAKQNNQTEVNHMVQRTDRIVIENRSNNYKDRDVTVLDQYGVKIIYQESLNDLIVIEEELQKIGSYFINKFEYQTNSDRQMSVDLLDRGEIAQHLIEKEFEFQFQKMLLVQQSMEIFENICDPLESVRVIQMISDIMAQRPRINLEASYFSDSYDADIEVMMHKKHLYNKIVEQQKQIEKEHNKDVQNFQELKFRKLIDHMNEKWEYDDHKRKKEFVGSVEEEASKLSYSQQNHEKAKQQLEMDKQKQIKLQKIAEKHITEFANNQYTDFAVVLGLPEITAEQLFQKQASKDHFIQDCLREQSHFSKQIEGYPHPLSHDKEDGSKFGLSCQNIGICDFYESLACITRVHAAMEQSFDELIKLHCPENGLALACLEKSFILEIIKNKFRKLNNILNKTEAPDSKAVQYLEQDFYFSNPDKLIFAMREFKAHLHPDLISTKPNPFTISKLSVQSVQNFDWPRILASQMHGQYEEISNEEMCKRMIQLAKNCVSRKFGNKTFQEPLLDLDHELDNKERSALDKSKIYIESPSLMEMCCNLVESMRIREDLIERVYETDLLTQIYVKQQTDVGKKQYELVGNNPIQFDTTSVIRENVNLIDTNDGSAIMDLGLPFLEFDQNLKAILNFKSENCVKSLMTQMGLEELRAIYQYQILQEQLLYVGVNTNQVMMDGCQRGLQELSFLKRDKKFTVPNSILNLKEILSTTAEGYHRDVYNKQVSKLKTTLTKDVNSHTYSIATKKAKFKPQVSKKYHHILTKVNSYNIKAETKLRILRAYRLKLLHTYCKETFQDLYKDALKIQNLQITNDLRKKAFLFPIESKVFEIGQGDVVENIPYHLIDQQPDKMVRVNQNKNLAKSLQDLKNIYYVPANEEVMLYGKKFERPVNIQDIQIIHDQISKDNIDQIVKECSKKPTFGIRYVKHPDFKQLFRKTTFAEAYSYHDEQLKLLMFLSLVTRIVNLEYIMGRNNSPSSLVLDLENRVLSGRPFWQKTVDVQQQMNFDQQNINNTEKVIKQITRQKEAKLNLAEDLFQIEFRLNNINNWMKKVNVSKMSLDYIIDLLNIHHHAIFYQFINGLENMHDIYLAQHKDDCFQKVQEVINLTLKRNYGINLYGNGYYLNQCSLNPMHLDIDKPVYKDYEQFQLCCRKAIDEEQLMPSQISLAMSIYGNSSKLESKNPNCLLNSYIRNYSELFNSFLNFSNRERKFAFTNFFELDQGINDYLVYKGLREDPKDSGKDSEMSERSNQKKNQIMEDPVAIIKATCEYLSFKIDSNHHQRVMMVWNNNCELPSTTREYEQWIKNYKDLVTLKQLDERDNLNFKYFKNKGDEIKRQGKIGLNDLSQQQQVDILMKSRQKEAGFFNKINQIKAETQVVKDFLDISMIKSAISMIKNEHSSLLAVFDQCGSELKVQCYVHPQQQFASTLFDQVDHNSHLDIINKLGFVQQFLTRLKNRCTEVETLTSGPGIVFSMKDFNECLTIFCKQLLKYSETQLRSRSETQHIKYAQYQHLIYLKEMQMQYYKRKCELFLVEIEKLINTKLSQRGNQIIYELDIACRELNTLKENFYKMEMLMDKQIRMDYEKTIVEQKNQIASEKQKFKQCREDLVTSTQHEVAQQIENIDQKELDRKLKELKKSKEHKQHLYKSNMSKVDDDEEQYVKKDSYYKVKYIERIEGLQNYIQKYKTFCRFKQVIAHEKHMKEMAIQQEKLSSNTHLWHQLGEAEKREQVTRQELNLTKQCLISYEKLIEKLQLQMENVKNQKERLQQYKNSKSKRIDELESKMKDLEILENIDLNKILEEMKNRDKRIVQLTKTDVNHSQEIESIKISYERRLADAERKLEHERSLKKEAYQKLEDLRLEMRAIEGKDNKSDIWKDKCKELFGVCKDLMSENEELKTALDSKNNQQYLPSLINTDLDPTSMNHKIQASQQINPTLSEANLYNKNFDKQMHSSFGRPSTKPSTATVGNNPRTISSGMNLNQNHFQFQLLSNKSGMRNPAALEGVQMGSSIFNMNQGNMLQTNDSSGGQQVPHRNIKGLQGVGKRIGVMSAKPQINRNRSRK